MNLYQVFLFFFSFDQKLPQSLLLWLNQFPKIQQDAFVSFILNFSAFGLKAKVKNKQFDHKVIHSSDCKCYKYYVMFNSLVNFPYSIIGKCITEDVIFHKDNNQVGDCKFFNEQINALDLESFTRPHKLKTRSLTPWRFRKFIQYEPKIKELTVYSLLTLMRTTNFDFMILTSKLDVIEISICILLATGKLFTEMFIERFLPIYCRSLRIFGVDKCKVDSFNMLNEIYDKIFNRNIREQFPKNSIPSLALLPIKEIHTLPLFNTNEFIKQVGYVGQRFVLSVCMNNLYVFNDYGESAGIYNQASPFDIKDSFIFECVETSDYCYFVDIYVANNTYLLNYNINERMLVLKALEDKIKKCEKFKLGAVCLNSEFNAECENVINGFNQIKSKSIILRYTNYICEYKLNVPNLKFNELSGLSISHESLCGYVPKYSGYALLKYTSCEKWGLYVWHEYKFICIGTLEYKFKLSKTSCRLVQVGFNCVNHGKLDEILYIRHCRYVSLLNCMDFNDIMKIRNA